MTSDDQRYTETLDEHPSDSMAATLVRRKPHGSCPDDTARAPLLAGGELVDHFEVVRQLGHGAMGQVYLARDSKLGRKVALKLMRPELFANAEAIARFQHEARAMARVNHPNVVTIHAVGEHRGMPYVAMEYVDGEPLSARLDSQVMAVDDALRISLGIAEALREAHKLGVVHRDLKPENVIASQDGRIRVVDFGLAKMQDVDNADTFAPTPVKADDPLSTLAGHRIGTPLYMSPEQWKAEETNSAVDVWALGVMLHEMLTGRVPFHAQNLVDLARRVCDDQEEVRIDERVPPPLRELVRRCLARDKSVRPDIHEVIEELRAASQHAPSPSSRPRPEEPASPPSVGPVAGILPWAIAGAVGLLVGGVAIALVVTTLRNDDAPSGTPDPPASSHTRDGEEHAEVTTEPSASTASPDTASNAGADATSSANASTDASSGATATPPRRAPQPVRRKQGDEIFSKPPSNAGY